MTAAPKQQLDFNDLSNDIRKRSTADLRYYLEHFRWPEKGQEQDLNTGASEGGYGRN